MIRPPLNCRRDKRFRVGRTTACIWIRHSGDLWCSTVWSSEFALKTLSSCVRLSPVLAKLGSVYRDGIGVRFAPCVTKGQAPIKGESQPETRRGPAKAMAFSVGAVSILGGMIVCVTEQAPFLLLPHTAPHRRCDQGVEFAGELVASRSLFEGDPDGDKL